MKRLALTIIAACVLCQPARADASAADVFRFSDSGQRLPATRPGGFLGIAGERLVCGGGLDASGQPGAELWIADDAGSGWQSAPFEEPVAFAGHATVDLNQGAGKNRSIVIVGGIGRGGPSDRAWIIGIEHGRPAITRLPALPLPLVMPGVAFFQDQDEPHLWVLGGAVAWPDGGLSSRVFRLDLNRRQAWEEMPPLPGDPVLLPGVACFYNDVHVFGGFARNGDAWQPVATARAFRWKPIDGMASAGWRDLAPVPRAAAAPLVTRTGQVHVTLAGGIGAASTGTVRDVLMAPRDGLKEIHLYHNVTDTWVSAGNLPLAAGAGTSFPSDGGHLIAAGTAAGAYHLWDAGIRRTVRNLAWIDYLTLFGYFALVAAFGLWVTRKQSGSAAFALGDRRIPWWVAGVRPSAPT